MSEFRDRTDAGDRLASELSRLLTPDSAGHADERDPGHQNQRGDSQGVQVLALPRGGVPVAAPIATELGARLSVLLVRKLGLPDHPELAMGAIAAIGERIRVVRNEPVLNHHRISDESWQQTLNAEQSELDRRMTEFDRWLPPDIGGKPVVLVDDGLATGQTMRAAIGVVEQTRPSRIIVAAPIAASQTVRDLSEAGVEVICPFQPQVIYAVGEAYRDFHQVTDAEMLQLLRHRPYNDERGQC